MLQVYRGLKNGCQDVAIKVLNHTGKAHLQQFENEIRLLKGLSFDRNIVQVSCQPQTLGSQP